MVSLPYQPSYIVALYDKYLYYDNNETKMIYIFNKRIIIDIIKIYNGDNIC